MIEPLFRPSQHEIMSYRGGLLGVIAVPGAGKTFTLAHLAAKLIQRLGERRDAEGSEVLIVTFTNAAVNNFKAKLAEILQQRRILLPYDGYRVRTLHGLANDILRERPALAGLADGFDIVDDREAARLRREAVTNWWKENSERFITAWVTEKYQPQMRRGNDKSADDLFTYVLQTAERFIGLAKDREQSPEMLRDALAESGYELPLAQFGIEIYDAYQKMLAQRGGVDFPDLSRRALQALRADKTFLKRLQKRWPYILEDEAQDSSKLQEEMLRLLSDNKNWVRVGDPNQAINTTFTTANPQFLRDFVRQTHDHAPTLDEAGRSAAPIFTLANELARWTADAHPVETLREALEPVFIRATSPADPKPNPPPDSAMIYIDYEPGKATTSDAEIRQIVGSLAKWMPNNPQSTVAILVPDNERGFRFVNELRDQGIAYEELLSSTTSTRAAAEQMQTVLGYLARPIAAPNRRSVTLGQVYRNVWWPLHLGRDQNREQPPEDVIRTLNGLDRPEELLYPEQPDMPIDWIEALRGETDADENQTGDPELADDLLAFIGRLRRWLGALSLPVDQLALIINQDLFTDPQDIALGYKFASTLRQAAFQHPSWRLPEFVIELRQIAERGRFLGFEQSEIGYEPKPGVVTVATMHQAKGLEWDRVYVTGVSNYVFPSSEEAYYYDEKYFIRGKLNLKAEIALQLESLLTREGYQEGGATLRARADLAAERLRLLYVAITRARRELMLSWNTGRFGNKETTRNTPALPLVQLAEFSRQNGSTTTP
jgi:DNA helicase II / ATP-dependent DNA helicase PcrA